MPASVLNRPPAELMGETAHHSTSAPGPQPVTVDPFGGDADAQAATRIPSLEAPSPFGNGGHDDVDKLIDADIAALDDLDDLRRSNAAYGVTIEAQDAP